MRNVKRKQTTPAPVASLHPQYQTPRACPSSRSPAPRASILLLDCGMQSGRILEIARNAATSKRMSEPPYWGWPANLYGAAVKFLFFVSSVVAYFLLRGGVTRASLFYAHRRYVKAHLPFREEGYVSSAPRDVPPGLNRRAETLPPEEKGQRGRPEGEERQQRQPGTAHWLLLAGQWSKIVLPILAAITALIAAVKG